MTSDEIIKWGENLPDHMDMEAIATRCLLEIAHQLAKLNERLDFNLYVDTHK